MFLGLHASDDLAFNRDFEAVHTASRRLMNNGNARSSNGPNAPGSVAYPDIKMQRLYESKNGKLESKLPSKVAQGVSSYNSQAAPFSNNIRNSRHSLPKMALNQSI